MHALHRFRCCNSTTENAGGQFEMPSPENPTIHETLPPIKHRRATFFHPSRIRDTYFQVPVLLPHGGGEGKRPGFPMDDAAGNTCCSTYLLKLAIIYHAIIPPLRKCPRSALAAMRPAGVGSREAKTLLRGEGRVRPSWPPQALVTCLVTFQLWLGEDDFFGEISRGSFGGLDRLVIWPQLYQVDCRDVTSSQKKV